MSEIEKIKRYIERTGIDPKTVDNYSIRTVETCAFFCEIERDWFGAISMIYNYGMARGYRAAKAEVKRR